MTLTLSRPAARTAAPALALAALLSACSLPGAKPAAVVSPTPAIASCTAAPRTTGPVATGISNPGGHTPIHTWQSRLPTGWTQTPESSLKSGYSLRAVSRDSGDSTTSSFLNVTVSAARLGSLASETLDTEIQKEITSAQSDGYKVDPRQEKCSVDGDAAVALRETKTDKNGTLHIYVVMAIHRGVDQVFNEPSATTYTIIAGSYDQREASVEKQIRGMAAGWRWLSVAAGSQGS